MRELAFPHTVHTHIHTYTQPLTREWARARAHSQTRRVVLPFAPFHRGSSARLGCARLAPGSREGGRGVGCAGEGSGRIAGSQRAQPWGARRKTGHSRLLSGFGGWLEYLHLPKFTGGQCLAHFYGGIIAERCLCAESVRLFARADFCFSNQFSGILESSRERSRVSEKCQ